VSSTVRGVSNLYVSVSLCLSLSLSLDCAVSAMRVVACVV